MPFEMPTSPDDCVSLSFDQNKEWRQKEAEAKLDPDKMDDIKQWVIETAYGEEVFAEIKVENRKVNDLFTFIQRATFGLSEEAKNLLRSGGGSPTQTA